MVKQRVLYVYFYVYGGFKTNIYTQNVEKYHLQ